MSQLIAQKMADKEKLDELVVQIRKLLKLTDEIGERDIYPVSFFSQAYDITSKIKESLNKMELTQIELFERQIKAHQAQLLSTAPHSEKKAHAYSRPVDRMGTQLQETVSAPSPATSEQQKLSEKLITAEEETMLIDLHQSETLRNQRPVEPPPPPVNTVRPESVNKAKSNADLKKRLTLNDRFRFARKLFDGDESFMNQTFSELNRMNSYDEGFSYLKSRFSWNFEDEAVIDFLTVLENYSNK